MQLKGPGFCPSSLSFSWDPECDASLTYLILNFTPGNWVITQCSAVQKNFCNDGNVLSLHCSNQEPPASRGY